MEKDLKDKKDYALTATGISKKYRLGGVSNSTLRDIFKKKTNEKKTSEEFWALKNLDFEIEKGQVVGFIGKNGAGKSTLLKILSQITKPTTGEITIKGKVASLLEVGTGFHPELTGSENIYLNGSILGMTRKEIKEKHEEIVEFSGVRKFIDTPVKHYSSGMYVRLAFSVAAHLDPDILILDEVLAVGDAEFQKKCLGKMKQVSSSGRTVLFVSHNMEAVKNLCEKVYLLEQGQIIDFGPPEKVIDQYLERYSNINLGVEYSHDEAPGNEYMKLKSAKIVPYREDGKSIITVKTRLTFEFEFWLEQEKMDTNLSVHLNAITGECVFNIITQVPVPTLIKGLYKSSFVIPEKFLNNGMFTVTLMGVKDTAEMVVSFPEILSFEVEEEREKTQWHGKFPGVVRPDLNFRIEA